MIYNKNPCHQQFTQFVGVFGSHFKKPSSFEPSKKTPQDPQAQRIQATGEAHSTQDSTKLTEFPFHVGMLGASVMGCFQQIPCSYPLEKSMGNWYIFSYMDG